MPTILLLIGALALAAGLVTLVHRSLRRPATLLALEPVSRSWLAHARQEEFER